MVLESWLSWQFDWRSHWDPFLCFIIGSCTNTNISPSTVNSIMHHIIFVICSELKMLGIPLSSPPAKHNLSRGFQSSQRDPNLRYRCIGALDYIKMMIERLCTEHILINYLCRKRVSSILNQVIVDTTYRCRFVSALCPGSTHDTTAIAVSLHAQGKRNGSITSWILDTGWYGLWV